MIRPILTYTVGADNNPRVLQEETRRVTDFSSEEVKACIRDLADTLADFIAKNGNKRGISGLSSTQIGSDLAISVVQTTERLYTLINPAVIEERGKERLFRVGCFSLFEYRAMVRYNDDVVIEYQDEAGSLHREAFKGDRSCIIQHEIDHLHGWLLFERLPHKEKDLFIPGDLPKTENTVPVTWRYSGLFNDYSDYLAVVDNESSRLSSLISAIEEITPSGGKILELGNGTGAASVVLSGKGYSVTCCQEDSDMLELDRNIGEANGASVRYLLRTSLPENERFDTVFSADLLQEMPDDMIVKMIGQFLPVASALLLCTSDPQSRETSVRSEKEWMQLFQSSGAESSGVSKTDYGYIIIQRV